MATLIVCAAIALQAAALFLVRNFWVYDALMVMMLFGMGMIFTASNTLAMNEGRANAGEASAILGVVGYVVGAIASPLVGMGNIHHSTAIVFLALGAMLLLLNIAAFRLPPDLNK